MTNIRKSLCWAAAILLTAFARQYGVFDPQATDTLLLVLPIVAILSIRNGSKCSLLRKKQA